MPNPTEKQWEAAREQATIEKANRPVVDWSSSRIKHEWTQGLESLEWTDADWRQLPSLRRHQHTDEYGGPLERKALPRCQHSVYLTLDPHPDLDYEDNVLEWKAPYCYCCYPEWMIYQTFEEFREGYRFLPTHPLEPGEYALQKDKLIDRQKVYPEIFTQAVLLRGRTLTADLRLQEDPETGKPRLETMGGYVAQAFGHGKAGLGHGPDDDSDDVRASWLSMSEEQEEQDGSEEWEPVGHAGWTATLPRVEDGIKDQPRTWCVNWQPPNMLASVERGYWIGGGEDGVEHNWEPYVWPVLYGDVRTNPTGELSVSETTWVVGETKEGWCTRIEWFLCKAGWLCRPTIQRPTRPIDGWQSSIEWVMCRGRWKCRIADAVPTAKHFAQWARKAEYNRGGGEHRIPLRRTKRWSDDWRGERLMRDLAATLKMYRYGTATDTPCGVAQQQMFDGVTREIQVTKMCATAYENYRQATLTLTSKKHGTAGWWLAGHMLGNERGASTGGKTPVWDGGNSKGLESLDWSTPEATMSNYGHRLEGGWCTEVEWSKLVDPCRPSVALKLVAGMGCLRQPEELPRPFVNMRINVAPHEKLFPSQDRDTNLHPWVRRYGR